MRRQVGPTVTTTSGETVGSKGTSNRSTLQRNSLRVPRETLRENTNTRCADRLRRCHRSSSGESPANSASSVPRRTISATQGAPSPWQPCQDSSSTESESQARQNLESRSIAARPLNPAHDCSTMLLAGIILESSRPTSPSPHRRSVSLPLRATAGAFVGKRRRVSGGVNFLRCRKEVRFNPASSTKRKKRISSCLRHPSSRKASNRHPSRFYNRISI